MNPVVVPMLPGAKLSAKDSPTSPDKIAAMKELNYKEIIGKLLYVERATRPDIAYALHVLCRFGQNPGKKHFGALKHLLRYLLGTIDPKLVYSPSSSLLHFQTYADASLDGDIDTSRSTGGFSILLGEGANLWGSRLQRHIALSSTESEFMNASMVGQEMVWMRAFFEELGYDVSESSPLFLDSNSAAKVIKNPEHQSTMKHVHHNFNWIRDKLESKEIRVERVAGVDNVADIFTKPLGKTKFRALRDKLGLR